jgi:hypothetical protein
MCDASSRICLFLLLIQLIVIVLSSLSVPSRVFTNVHLSMPVTTRSKTRSGLQDSVSLVPPPPISLTCSNAITNTLKTTDALVHTDSSIYLSELVHPLTLSSSSSAVTSNSNSSLDSSFVNLKISNFHFVQHLLLPHLIFNRHKIWKWSQTIRITRFLLNLLLRQHPMMTSLNY